MASYLKRRISAKVTDELDREVRQTVESILDVCAIERFWGHKEQADLRLRRYGGQNVGLGPNVSGALFEH